MLPVPYPPYSGILVDSFVARAKNRLLICVEFEWGPALASFEIRRSSSCQMMLLLISKVFCPSVFLVV